MRCLLDTCAFIHAVTDYNSLGADVRALMEDYNNMFYISQETVREVILKYKNKNIWGNVWKSAEDIIDSILKDYPFVILPIQEEHLRTYARLEINEAEGHKDPSDHLIIAHAITNKMPLITCDRKFKFYVKQGLELIYYGK